MVHRELPTGVALHPTASLTPEDQTENKELVLAFKRGDDGSYQAIYDRYSARVRGICRRMLDHPHDAEEASQEAFVRVFTALPSFNGRYQLGAWMARIATNVCLDHIRSKGRKPADSTDQEDLVDLSDDSADGPEEIFIRGDERRRVREVLSELAPMHRAALALREFEGMSYADIAVALGMTEPQVKALIHRARRSFKKRWAHGFALLLPWRLLARLRRFSTHYDTPPHIADAAASTANFASSCSAAMQQCGAFVTDKVAGAMTAVIVGTAAVGVAAAPVDVSRESYRSGPAAVAATNDSPLKDDIKGIRHDRPTKRGKNRRAFAADPAEPEPETEPKPQPSPTPTPQETGTAPAEEAQPQPQVQPSYGPLAPAIGWDRADEVPPTQPTAQSTTLDCSGRRLTQRVETVIHDDSVSYPAVLQLWVGDGAPRLDLAVTKDGRTATYNGGAPELVVAGSGRDTAWGFTGSYSAYGSVRPDEMGLPSSGRFTARLSLDCLASVVKTESVLFTTG